MYSLPAPSRGPAEAGDIGDWNRPMWPQVWITINNPDAAARGRKVGRIALTDLVTVRDEVKQLSRRHDSLEFRNYAGKSVVVRRSPSERYLLVRKDRPLEVEMPDAVSALAVLEPFLIRDEWPAFAN